MKSIHDVVVIGGGQSGLASAYYLKKAKLNFIVLDEGEVCGGAWLKAWDSLTLFSPAEYSSLPGWLMPKSENIFPVRQEVVHYLCAYEQHYQIPVQRSVHVEHVLKEQDVFQIQTNKGSYWAKAVIAATGTWGRPFIPAVDGIAEFKGVQLHSANYKNAMAFKGQNVLVVGEGNSGAQIVAEISRQAHVKWSTHKPPEFLPEEVDGYYLFNLASAKYHAEKEGKAFDASSYSLGNIVMVPSVKEARLSGVLVSNGRILRITEDAVIWENGDEEKFDAIIWCTGFGYNTTFLETITQPDERGKVKTTESRSLDIDGLWLVGYGYWTGFASATLIGLNRNAKQTINEISEFINKKTQNENSIIQ